MIQQQTAIPADILNLDDYDRKAREILPHPVYEYIAGGCGAEITVNQNFADYRELGLYTRVLRDFEKATCSQKIFSSKLNHPIIAAPVAHQKLVHPRGELATAQACEASDTPLIVSTLSSFSLEEIARQSSGEKWFQLYWQQSRSITQDLVKRAENAGFRTLVVTVDTPVTALRYRSQRADFKLPSDVIEANLTGYTVQKPRRLGYGESAVFTGLMADAPTWKEIDWLRQQTELPILIKGLTHPADARQAMDCGTDGVVVSNHGGRSLDGIPSSIKLLSAIRRATGESFPILIDGGIRSGSDIFKALALGANAVLIGRPQVMALAVAGALGVAHMIKLLKEELEVTMALAGCPTLNDITENCIY